MVNDWESNPYSQQLETVTEIKILE